MNIDGPWSEPQISRFLEDARFPLRLSVNGSTGWPVLLSLWFVPLEGALWCASVDDARVVRLLAGDPRCAFEAAADTMPYRGVRGRGTATLEPARGEEILRRLIERYLGRDDGRLARWLLSRADREVAIRIAPERLTTWDFTARMSER